MFRRGFGKRRLREASPFWELFAHAFGVFFLFNLADLLVIDWLIVCGYAPSWLISSGHRAHRAH